VAGAGVRGLTAHHPRAHVVGPVRDAVVPGRTFTVAWGVAAITEREAYHRWLVVVAYIAVLFQYLQ